MKVSRDRVLENKRTILMAAGRLFRERGFESVTVTEHHEGSRPHAWRLLWLFQIQGGSHRTGRGRRAERDPADTRRSVHDDRTGTCQFGTETIALGAARLRRSRRTLSDNLGTPAPR